MKRIFFKFNYGILLLQLNLCIVLKTLRICSSGNPDSGARAGSWQIMVHSGIIKLDLHFQKIKK